MNIETTDDYYTRNILIQIAVLGAICVGIIFWQREFLYEVYFNHQVSNVGLVINGGIVALFLAGLSRLITLFLRYHREEQMLNRFILNVRQKVEPSQGVDTKSLIIQRYRTLLDLHNRRSQINHNALASTLLAGESSRNGFPRFVNSVLILTGVFGTIVSLSIALLGASDMIAAITEIEGLGTIIHGMSTALSTTMTAIVAYLFFGYFYAPRCSATARRSRTSCSCCGRASGWSSAGDSQRRLHRSAHDPCARLCQRGLGMAIVHRHHDGDRDDLPDGAGDHPAA
jgi:hypothetical protein